MARLAGLDDVGPTQRGTRIGDRQDVVRPVAVIALCGSSGPELGYLAVERLEVAFRYVEVAFSALIQNALSKLKSSRSTLWIV